MRTAVLVWLQGAAAPVRPLARYTTGTVVHYLAPTLLVAVVAMAVFVLRKQEPLRRLLRITGHVGPVVVPRLLAFSTFIAGTILLFSGATPAVRGRLRWVADFLPLPVIEVSHLFGSLAGAALLILARGLQRRLDAAYHLTVALLAAGVLFSLLKAFDYEEAIILSAMLVALVASRRYFYRRASLVRERFTPAWIAAILLVVLGSIALGLISYGTPVIRGDLFWNFSVHAQGPRFLRATTGVLAMLVMVAAARLLRPARPLEGLPTEAELEAIRPLVEASPVAAAHLVSLGDKSLLVNEDRTGFVMYGVAGRSWVSMGDPVATADRIPALVLRFIRMADQHGGWPVFYEVARQHVHLYLDLGFGVVKLGEEGRVPLDDFTLEGPERRNLRRTSREMVRAGCTFEMLAPGCVEEVLPTLRQISDAWLATKRTREKRFSLGFFDERYVRRYPVAVARRSGQIVGFANVWPSGCKEELQVDLMRSSPEAPPGLMRWVLTETMLWGREQGYRWFNLGMAPLSGVQASTMAPWWNQLAVALYGHGGRFYNFQGVRDFKEWFRPVWEPKYLASPPGALRPVIVANIASLIAGGLEGVVRR
ncbi:MAG TPA: bifunctional lysylphosphatidylglycerol flippase/synthetase MprF [Gemmatimonadaceae bacterium]|nr:bifunctional lysylphosphatidylglycerol flippase/synthetase MprF [Gemmatimonadaceae bacterium]